LCRATARATSFSPASAGSARALRRSRDGSAWSWVFLLVNCRADQRSVIRRLTRTGETHCAIAPYGAPTLPTSRPRLRRSPDAAKADVACRGVDRLRVARRRPVAAAVIGRAQIGAALEHLARNLDVRLARVAALHLAATARILRDAAGLRRVRLVL